MRARGLKVLARLPFFGAGHTEYALHARDGVIQQTVHPSREMSEVLSTPFHFGNTKEPELPGTDYQWVLSVSS